MKGATIQVEKSRKENKVSIRAPREGGDEATPVRYFANNAFQSAPPVKGATKSFEGELYPSAVSIRAPREGGDGTLENMAAKIAGFNPRPP